ncbi:conserved hypothetical protein [Nostocoides japonicum T1-X7]|uniref:ATPase involved in DNA repair n=1 Tax=Nostocoides japonicum T1-X7 TaxID=1194083 RepID=A0A077LWS6_9MICO|nr:DUF349 domain-containing protein [Tetrasphaera japonica]CCH78378.1 conserved hypothetical protein [Tetrasphaera japonica T1-X7]
MSDQPDEATPTPAAPDVPEAVQDSPEGAQAPEDVSVPAAEPTPTEPVSEVTAADGADSSEGQTPSAEVPTPAVESAPEPSPASSAADGPDSPEGQTPSAEVPAPAAESAPSPTPAPKPGPPRIPTPAAIAKRVHPAPAAAAPAHSDSARFGRVDEATGTVYVTDGDGEREVGAYPGATPHEALQYFARKYDELAATVELLHQRLTATDVGAKDAAEALALLQEQTTEPAVVGDLAALHTRVTEVEALVERRREAEAAERAAARAAAVTEREALVAEAERIAGQPVERIQWRQSSERMRALLDEWKHHQRSGPKIDKPTENAMWQRFSHARNAFDKARRAHFAQLEVTQGDAKRTKEALVKEAEQLATSKDWGPTARAFKQLMDRWRQAGRAARSDDEALWQRFKAAQDAFFAAKDEVSAAEEAEFRANLEVKEALLAEAQALLPVKDLDAAKAALRTIQDKWERAGKVPRADVDRMERGMRAVESAVRDAEDARWKRSNPEVEARASSLVTQLETSLAALRDDLAKAEAAGNDRRVKEITAKVETQQAWLTQARKALA